MSTDTDRELLEAAARAAGVELGADRIDCGVSITEAGGRHRYLPPWNPLTDDGDALRLAVNRNLWPQREHHSDGEFMVIWVGREVIAEPVEPDPAAATRRAIVRAAAAIAQEPPCPKT